MDLLVPTSYTVILAQKKNIPNQRKTKDFHGATPSKYKQQMSLLVHFFWKNTNFKNSKERGTLDIQ